jgi:hypothetical protein
MIKVPRDDFYGSMHLPKSSQPTSEHESEAEASIDIFGKVLILKKLITK